MLGHAPSVHCDYAALYPRGPGAWAPDSDVRTALLARLLVSSRAFVTLAGPLTVAETGVQAAPLAGHLATHGERGPVLPPEEVSAVLTAAALTLRDRGAHADALSLFLRLPGGEGLVPAGELVLVELCSRLEGGVAPRSLSAGLAAGILASPLPRGLDAQGTAVLRGLAQALRLADMFDALAGGDAGAAGASLEAAEVVPASPSEAEWARLFDALPTPLKEAFGGVLTAALTVLESLFGDAKAAALATTGLPAGRALSQAMAGGEGAYGAQGSAALAQMRRVKERVRWVQRLGCVVTPGIPSVFVLTLPPSPPPLPGARVGRGA